MYLFLKSMHIAAMTVWFTGLFFLPRLFVARHREEIDSDPAYFNRTANNLFFRVMTPAGVVTIALGMSLMLYGPQGAWLVLKLILVSVAVCIHLYYGVLLYELGRGNDRHGVAFYRILGWVPLALVLVLAALSGGKLGSVGELPPPPHGEPVVEPEARAAVKIRQPGAASPACSSATSESMARYLVHLFIVSGGRAGA